MTWKTPTNFNFFFKLKTTLKFRQKQLSFLKTEFSKFAVILHWKQLGKVSFRHRIGKIKFHKTKFYQKLIRLRQYNETYLQWTPSGPQNSVRYREVSAT